MAKEKPKKEDISDTTRFYLDSYANASLAEASPELKHPAMRILYKRFLVEDDPIISRALAEAQATEHTISEYQKAQREYDDKISKSKKGKAPEKPNIPQEFQTSLDDLKKAINLYSDKFNQNYGTLTVSQALSYTANENGTLPFEINKTLQDKLKSDNDIINTLPENHILKAVGLLGYYKIQGETHNNLIRSIVEGGLENLTTTEKKETIEKKRKKSDKK